jgi:deoxyribonucleoside regulator
MRGNATEKFDRRLVQTCKLFYEERLSKSEIARRQQLSVTHVNRLLLEGQRLGFVEIRVVGPRLKSLELELLSKYRFRDVRIASSASDPSATLVEIGKQGAAIFEEVVAQGSRVGVSSGRTMFELVSHVPERPRNISVYPLNVIHEGETKVKGVSASTSATILWFRSRPSAEAYRVEFFFPDSNRSRTREFVNQLKQDASIRRVRESLDNLDIYLLGAGEAGLESRFSALHSRRGADSKPKHRSLSVGDIAFNAINEEGELVTTEIEDLIFHVDLSTLKEAARSSDRLVVLVAGGMNKSRIIEAAIKARVCNALVTDSDVAEYLLRDKSES